jgi:hypothetical protein
MIEQMPKNRAICNLFLLMRVHIFLYIEALSGTAHHWR